VNPILIFWQTLDRHSQTLVCWFICICIARSYYSTCNVTHVLHENIYADFIVHQEHELFTLFDLNSNVSTYCLLPTRVFQSILLLFPKILPKMRRQKSLVLNIEDDSGFEMAVFRNAEKFLKSALRFVYKPFRLSKVNLLLIYMLSLKYYIRFNFILFSLFSNFMTGHYLERLLW
jgi:hypothetical protein